MSLDKMPFVNRDVSWLDFNQRVLQEAEDENVPLIERIRFLGIYSNNLDEFYRVRVATLNRMIVYGNQAAKILGENPKTTLKQINKIALKFQVRFEKAYETITKQLENENIFILNENNLLPKQQNFVLNYFNRIIRPTLGPIMLNNIKRFPSLEDNAIYFALRMEKSNKEIEYAIVEIPSIILPRFIVLPKIGNKKYIILLDDVIRFNLSSLFKSFHYKKIEAFTIKITKDAELDLDNDVLQNDVEKIAASVKKRKKGKTVRFIFDKEMPKEMLSFILETSKTSKDGRIVAAGRYHNFKDFIDFPNIGLKRLEYKKANPLIHPLLENRNSIFSVVDENDIFLSYPYQKFNYIIDLLREAAIDPNVKSIKISLYRVAGENSKIIHSLINAAKNGKKVMVIVELRARFDEENNINLANKLKEEGIQVLFGFEGIKVHAKMILIERNNNKKVVRYAQIGTGNFNERTATKYTDVALITTNKKITNEVNSVFNFFNVNFKRPNFNHLIVSPFNVREKITLLIDNEIKFAKNKKRAFINIKINSLTDREIISKLYEASKYGVQINLFVRGICSLIPQKKGWSENITVISIVDKYLEHSRIMNFCNGGKELFYITSADWMTRNLDNRIEVGCPIYDKKIQELLRINLEFHLKDNQKARHTNSSISTANCDENPLKRYKLQQEMEKFFTKNSKFVQM
ncbi:MAG: polyphosphate kinase 1 [Flavobacteriales bacterium CG18_big_fil_WC_8_21_14_2_50_32_9]|nr:MAG: polyphosphate kinase 1 [Flavobacteriales bacterium CG18_big_fil_WC_8_21_14_2_50_32_9]